MDAVVTENLSKTYQNGVKALKEVNLTIKKGELFTLLGPNGAGKTTFLRIISTQLLPTSGEAYVLGYNVVEEENEVRKHIAIVPQDIATYGNFTPWEYAYYFALLRDLPKNKAKEKAEESLKAIGLWNLRKRTCATLSGGEKKRAIIASALSSDAQVLMLDEPTSGLDAVARRNVWSVLRDMVKEGKTILLTTHIMEEAEIISDRVAIINKGVITAVGSLDEIKEKVKQKFRVIVEGNSDVLSGYANIARFGDKFVVYLEDEDEAIDLVKKLLKSGKRAEVSPITLEDVFVKLVGGWENENA